MILPEEFVSEVKRRVDIVTLIGRDARMVQRGDEYECCDPFTGERTASMYVNPAKQVWSSFSGGQGGAGGDAISYVMKRNRCSFTEAVLELADEVGIRPPNASEAEWEHQRSVASARARIHDVLAMAVEFYHSNLTEEYRDEFLRKGYGFSDETIDHLKLGIATRDSKCFHYLIGQGVSEDDAAATGLFSPSQFGDGAYDNFSGRLIFPYWRRGRVVYLIGRWTRLHRKDVSECGKYYKLLTRNEKRPYISEHVVNGYFYNEDVTRGSEKLVITEGVTDCITAMQAGLSCISPVTTSFSNEQVPKLIELTAHCASVTVCNDNEANGSGDKGARKTAETLWNAGRKVSVATLPREEGVDKVDINSFVRERGPEALRAVIASALPFPIWLLRTVPIDVRSDEVMHHLKPVLEALGRTDDPAIQNEAQLEITKRFGIGKRDLNRLLKNERENARYSKLTTEQSTAATQDRHEILVGESRTKDIVFEEVHENIRAANQRRIARASAGNVPPRFSPLFLNGGEIVKLTRDHDSCKLEPIREDFMFGFIAREFSWVRLGEKGLIRTSPEHDVAKDIMVGSPDLPVVESVITTPVYGASGKLLLERGLHEDDRAWVEASHLSVFAEGVPEAPTQEQVDTALALITDDLLIDFPFKSQADRAAAIAGLLCPFVRRMIKGPTPLHVIEAPGPGTGKSLLCELISIIATGSGAESRQLSEQDEELRKSITAELTTGRPIVLFDNAKEGRTIDSPALASLLTNERWNDRKLGETSTISIAVKVTWFLTGNNPRLSKDIARRSIRIRIDAKKDKAWKRTGFKHANIKQWARDNRAQLIAACLTLVQAWIAAGKPNGNANLGSFESWSAIMSGIFDTIGLGGFLTNLDELYSDADSDGEQWRDFVAAWWIEHRNDQVSASTLVSLCERNEDMMSAVRGDGGERTQANRLNKALRGARDQVHNGCVITKDGKFWRLRSTDDEPEPVKTIEPGAPIWPEFLRLWRERLGTRMVCTSDLIRIGESLGIYTAGSEHDRGLQTRLGKAINAAVGRHGDHSIRSAGRDVRGRSTYVLEPVVEDDDDDPFGGL